MTPSSNACPACNGHGCTHVNGYKLDTCQVCEGTGALVTVGVRGAMSIIHATDGIASKDSDTAKYAAVMTGIKMKLV